MRMKDKCGIVTAAGSGMGRAGAIRFAKEGAAVAVVDIDAEAVQAVVAEIEAAGGRAVGITADLTRDEDSRRIVREAANALGGIDFVWNHVGHPGPASVEGIEMKDFDTAVTLNMRTVLVTTEAAIPEMRARGGGALLYTASTSGLRGSQFSPVYSAVKHGVVGFVKALGKRLAKENIRVNAICPGPTDTPMLRVFRRAPGPAIDTRARQGATDRCGTAARCPWAGPASRRRSPMRRSSCSPTKPPSSRPRRSRWTAARPRDGLRRALIRAVAGNGMLCSKMRALAIGEG